MGGYCNCFISIWQCSAFIMENFESIKLIVLIFENIKSVDNRLKVLGHFIDHWKFRNYMFIAVIANVISGIIFCKFLAVYNFFNNAVMTYTIHVLFIYFNMINWTMILNFCLLVLTVRQRMQELGKCITDFKFTQQRNVPNILILSVLPAVECTSSQSSESEYQIRQIKGVKSACKELLK